MTGLRLFETLSSRVISPRRSRRREKHSCSRSVFMDQFAPFSSYILFLWKDMHRYTWGLACISTTNISSASSHTKVPTNSFLPDRRHTFLRVIVVVNTTNDVTALKLAARKCLNFLGHICSFQMQKKKALPQF